MPAPASTASTSTSASDIDQLCDAPTDIDVQRACLSAEETVTDPDTGTGMYEQVEAWSLEAGAPYATAELGVMQSLGSDATSSWDSSYAYIFPRDLLEFTNNATDEGESVSNCASPLTSMSPCGFTVGSYDLQLPSRMSYGGINGHWKSMTGDVLLLLLAPYNDKAFGATGGTLGGFMASIGFSSALTSTSAGLIVTTANTGKNGASGQEAICFMDTSAPRDKAKQPWCDGIENEVQGTDDLLDGTKCGSVEHTWTQELASRPAFYTALLLCQTGHGKEFNPAPGWLVSSQTSPGSQQSIFWQYHWPVTDVSEIGCQNGKPYTDPGGLLSRCAGDLQEYVDAQLPRPTATPPRLRRAATPRSRPRSRTVTSVKLRGSGSAGAMATRSSCSSRTRASRASSTAASSPRRSCA